MTSFTNVSRDAKYFVYIICAILIYFDPFGPTKLPFTDYTWIKIICIINNVYQIVVHFALSLMFFTISGWKNIIPGANDRQSSIAFNTSTIIDFLGWSYLGYFSGVWNLLTRFLAYIHLSTGMMSLVDHKIFMTTFIHNNELNLSKAIFVMTDAIVRGLMLWMMISF